MPSLSNAFRSTLSGAATGFGFGGGPWGAIAGGAVGFVSSLFDKDPEEERRRRRAELLAEIAKARTARLERGTREINQGTTGAMSNAAAAAAKRAASLGRSDVEAFLLPGQSAIAEAGSNALRGFQTETENYFDQAQLEAEFGFAGRPIEPGITDYLEELGVAGLQYKSAQDRVSAMKDIYGTKPQSAPQREIDLSQRDVVTTPYQTDFQRPTWGQPVDFTRQSRKPTNLVDAYRHAVGR